ncbi:hypothetical protein T09_5797 [Trichinella sp. T9]|nr:hypothetical protein T09_5797 [Trichinella sp. T9]
MPWQTASQLTNSIAFSETKTHVKAYWHTRNDRVDLKLYLACSVKDFGGELLIQNGIQRRIFVVTNVQIENIIVENVNMKYIKWIKHKLKSPVLHELYERRIGTDCLKQRFKICLLSSENENCLRHLQF